MHLFAIIGIGVAVLFVYVGFKAIQDATARNSRRGDWAIFIVRYLIGSHWTGRPQTDAGWKRRGTKALTQTGYALPFYFRPHWHRLCLRVLWTFGPVAAAVGLVMARHPTELVLILVGAWWLLLRLWKLYKSTRKRWHRKEWLDPVHSAIAPRVGMPPSERPTKWIDVETDKDRAIQKTIFHLPPGFNRNEHERELIAEVAAKRLGMESPDVTWELEGNHPLLTLQASNMPTDIVRFKDVLDYIKNSERDDLVLGIGKQRQPVIVSLHDDSPHLGASMGAGAGKSTLARFLAAQALHKGCIVLILDIKQSSHPWARGLPNVSYCDTAELIHDALVWLGTELDRRNDVAKYNTDYEGSVNANVGPRILIVAEELNMTANKLKSYWKDELQGQGQSPALISLQDVAFAGRQVMMNLFMVGQMLTARVTGGQSGGGEARENVGIRMLARFTKRNWNLLVPEHPMPANSGTMGRIQVIASGEVRETQVAYLTGAQAREWSTNGTVSPIPSDMPGATLDLSRFRNQNTLAIPTSPANQPVSPDQSANKVAFPPAPITLSEAVTAGLIKTNINTARTWRRLDADFPKPVDTPPGGKSTAHYYDPVSLSDYQENRKKK